MHLGELEGWLGLGGSLTPDERKKADVALSRVPVIVLSAAAKKDPSSPYFLDVEEIVSKPIEMDELVGAIRRLVPREDVP